MSNHLYDGLLAGRESDCRNLFQIPQDRCWSYAEVVALSGSFANFLVAAGVKPGDRVAAQIDKSVEGIALYLATIRAGAVFLPLNTAYTKSEIAYFVEDAEPSLLVCDSSREAQLIELVAAVGGVIRTLDATGKGTLRDAAKSFDSEFENRHRAAQDLAAILYTSGTTGLSKGAMLSHDNLLSNALTLADYWQFEGDDLLMHALPIFHTHGLFVAINTSLIVGSSMIFLARFDVDVVIQQLPRATVMMAVPTFYTRLLSHAGFNRELVAHMRLFISGSAPLLEETHIQFEQVTGQRFLERYGMTETNMNTSNPYQGERRAGTVGLALPGIEIRICDTRSGVEMRQGETGMIEVRGPNVFLGYWRKPEKTAAELRDDGFFISGDLGLLDADGYLHIVGREKDLIISGGYNIYPKEIEVEIDALDGIIESAVFGISDADRGELVAAAVVLDAGSDWNESSIFQTLKPVLAGFKLPRKVFFVAELPRNSMGKVQKNRLRDIYA